MAADKNKTYSFIPTSISTLSSLFLPSSLRFLCILRRGRFSRARIAAHIYFGRRCHAHALCADTYSSTYRTTYYTRAHHIHCFPGVSFLPASGGGGRARTLLGGGDGGGGGGDMMIWWWRHFGGISINGGNNRRRAVA